VMASRWGYEAIAVKQYNGNPYTKDMFPFEMVKSEAKYRNTYWRPEVESLIDITSQYLDNPDDPQTETLPYKLQVLRHAFATEKFLSKQFEGRLDELFDVKTYSKEKAQELKAAVVALKPLYTAQLLRASESIDSVNYVIKKSLPEGETIGQYKDQYFNERLYSIMQNEASEDKFVNERGMLIQVMDPGFQEPLQAGPLNYRAHFYAPIKHFAGMRIDTLTFNMIMIWFMTAIFYVALYYEWIAKFIGFLGNLGKKER
ncbi:MAG: hypothetical protein ACPGJS_07550, partial [Flammeovirgaceae bacterium]